MGVEEEVDYLHCGQKMYLVTLMKDGEGMVNCRVCGVSLKIAMRNGKLTCATTVSSRRTGCCHGAPPNTPMVAPEHTRNPAE